MCHKLAAQMSDEVGAESPEEQKGRAAAEQASALEKLTDRVLAYPQVPL